MIRRSALVLSWAVAGFACGGPGNEPPGSGDGGTPGNDSGVIGPDADPCAPLADRPGVCPGRGLYDGPLSVELRAPAGAELFYSLDGSPPSASGIRYDGPIAVEPPPDRGLVVLRARAVTAGGEGPIVTHSYVFPGAVLTQSAAPAGAPAIWGIDSQRPADYEMDGRVLADRDAAASGLSALPTVSLVLDPGGLFGEAGLYMNPEAQGVEWEHPVSAELFGAGDAGFQVDCGVRVQGGSSTEGWKAPKLSLRLLFKEEYGPGHLEYPLFADSPVERFDTLVLDAHLNLTWVHPAEDQRIRAQLVRDGFVSDLQNAVGSLAPHGRWVHLYLDGLYWGLYELHERPDEAFAAEHLGGDEAEYDVLRHTGQTVVSGDDAAWRAMFDLARDGLDDPDRYAAVAGMLDVDDFIDYMLINFYTGNDDWPHHNWYAARRRAGGTFRFFSWDAEHVLKDPGIDRTGVSDGDGPGELYQALLDSPDFRARVSARAAELVAPGAPLFVDPDDPIYRPGAPDRNRPAALYMRRADEIRPAVVLESARWGDTQRPDAPYGPAEWQAELDWLLTEYFPVRSAVFAGQLSE